MDITVTGFIWSKLIVGNFDVAVPSPTVPSPYLELWPVIPTSFHFSSQYPLGDEAIAGKMNVWEETLLLFPSRHSINVHCQCLLLEFTDTEKPTQASIVA